jgi:D-alanyl-D-alanine carboxypeptidase (penicillin-binding protein 5/6)
VRRRGLLAAFAALLWALAGAAPAPAAPASGPKLHAKAWALIDARTGERLAGHSASRELPIASTTKLMTAHLALEELPLRKRLVAPAYDAAQAESILGLAPGERMTVRDLIYALVLQSANDAAVTLAKGVSGSQRRFVIQMNRSAQALGLTGTHYTNPVGLDEPGNYSTAADLVALGRLLLQGKFFAQVADSRKAVLRSGAKTRRIFTRNTLEFKEPWVTGVKTGHTLDAGYVLVAAGHRKGTDLISAVLGTSSEGARDAESLKLLDYGFSLFHRGVAVRKGAVSATPDIRYRDEDLPVVAARDLRVTTRTGERVATRVHAPGEVNGPIAAGQELGRVFATVDGKPAGSVPLVAARAVPKAGILRRVAHTGLLPVALLVLGIIVIVVGLRRRPRRPRAEPPAESDWSMGSEEPESMRDERRRMREERRKQRQEGPR